MQRARRCEEPESDSGNGGMDAGAEGRIPDRDAEQPVPRHDAHAGPFRHVRGRDPDEGSKEPAEGQVRCVEQGDHEDRSDVVGQRQGEQEEAGAARQALADECDHAEHERDVGRHRDPPSGCGVAAGVEGEVDQRRHQHPAERRQGRHGSGLAVLQRSQPNLALDLQADDEEEERHQGVVDEPGERFPVLPGRSGREPDLGVPEHPVRRLRDVGPRQRGQRGRDEDDA